MLNHHPLIQGAAHSDKRYNPFTALLVMMLLVLLGELLGLPLKLLFTPLLSLLPNTVFVSGLEETLTRLLLPFGGIILAIALYVRVAEKRTFASLGLDRQPTSKWLARYGMGFVIGILAMSAFVIAALLMGIYDFKGLSFQTEPSNLLSLLVILPGWIVQGASEEILTRGWLFQATARKNFYLGVFMSTVLFSLLHLANDGLTALSLINLMLYGLFALVLSLYTESLWAACGFHAAWNWAQGNIFGILVSGSTTKTGSLFALGASKGPHWLTGGPFGAEGSLLVSALLLIMIIGCCLGIKRKVPSWSEKSSCEPYPH